MKAIITGATSGLGRNLVNYLKNYNYEIIALGRNEKVLNTLDVKTKKVDLSILNEIIKSFEEADVVFHCAALSSPWGTYSDFYNSNVVATENVIEMMNLYNIPKIVHVSTPSIYFNFKDQLNIKENYENKSFVNYYAKTKYEAEQVVLNSNVHSTIIRPRGIFGEYDQALIPRLEKVSKKGFLPMTDKNPIVDISYVGNVVHSLYLASIKDIQSKEIFNITNDEPQSLEEIYNTIVDVLKWNVKIKKISSTKLYFLASILESISKFTRNEPMLTKYGVGLISTSQTLNIQKAKSLLNYKPIYTIKEGFENYVKWKN